MKKNVGIVFGGYSGESEVSQNSAINVFQLVSTHQYNKYLIELDKDRQWWLHLDGRRIPKTNLHGLEFRINDEDSISIEVICNFIHGNPGETGELQGFLDTINIPCTGSGITTMVTTFNKHVCNTILDDINIKVAKNYVHMGEVVKQTIIDIADNLGTGPYFIKPNSGGSSLGAGLAHSEPDLLRLLNQALEHDTKVLVEEYVSGREFSVGIIEHEGTIIALPVTEIISDNEFFDYAAKYDGAVKEITPANISDIQSKVLHELGVKIFNHFDCKDMIRFEVILNELNDCYVLDINTIPGFTDTSILPQQIKKAGIDPADFVNQMIERAIELRL